MKKYILMFALVLSLGGSLAFGHAGHDKTPGEVIAPHGGTMQGTSEIYLELVNDSLGIKLYPMSHELKPIALNMISVLATSQVPKKKKEPVNFNKVDDHFEAQVAAKGAYRYMLEVSTNFKGKTEKVKFQVEPQS